MAVRQSTTTQLPGVLGFPLATEQAVNVFGIGAGIFGGLAGLVAGQRLKNVDGKIQLGRVIPSLLVSGISTVVGALLLPSGG